MHCAKRRGSGVGRAYAGVTVVGVDIGGLRAREIRERIVAVLVARDAEPIVVTTLAESFFPSMNQLGLAYDLDATVARAMAQGSGGSRWDQSIPIASSRLHSREVILLVRADAPAFHAAIVELATAVVVGALDVFVNMSANENRFITGLGNVGDDAAASRRRW